MASRRRPPRADAPSNEGRANNTPIQQDEADILEEAGAELDEGGQFVADEESVRELGALDVETVLENRRLGSIVGKKRANQKGVAFNTGDLLVLYDQALKVWPANTLDIYVRRLTGAPVQDVIMSRPRSGAELRDALMMIHGIHQEAEYEVKLLDNNSKVYRATRRIVLPDTRPPSVQQGQQHMSHYYPPNPYNPHGGNPYNPQGGNPYAGAQNFAAPTQGVPPPPVPQAQPQQQQQPAMPMPMMPAQAPLDVNGLMGMLLDMLQRAQAQAQAGAQPTVSMAPPPAPAPGAPFDVQGVMAIKQLLDTLQQAAGGPRAAQPAPTPAPIPHAMPYAPAPFEGPPGTIYVPGVGFVPMMALARAMGGATESVDRERPQFRGGPRPPPYMRGHEDRDQEGGYRPPPPRYAPPPPPPSAADQFRDAITVFRSASQMVREVGSILPGQERDEEDSYRERGGGVQQQAAPDDSPVRVVDTGHGKFVVSAEDGSFRMADTLFANAGPIFEWASKQADEIRKSNERRALREQAQPQRLQEGHVEVRPGFQPPPGFRAVAVNPEEQAELDRMQAQEAHPHHHQHQPYQQPQQGSGLPPVPDELPPPVQTQGWAAPVIPGR